MPSKRTVYLGDPADDRPFTHHLSKGGVVVGKFRSESEAEDYLARAEQRGLTSRSEWWGYGIPDDAPVKIGRLDLSGRPMLEARRRGSLPDGGDCYEVAGNFIGEQLIAGNADRYVLVHGEVRGQGPLQGVNFGHAWVVDVTTDTVIDRSNGRNITMPRFIYYAIGGIEEIDNMHEYPAAAARDMMLETGNYGPWDLVTSSGL